VTTAIGDVSEVDLIIHRNADLTFSLEWWEDDAATVPVNVEAMLCLVKASDLDEEALLDVGSFATFVDNVASVDVPAATTLALLAGKGVWDCILVAEDGRQVKFMRGTAFITDSASI
jgi:hypothetical protein